MVSHDGHHRVSVAAILRLVRDEGLALATHYHRERRKLIEGRT
jgi:hypothetical protein